MYGNVLTVYNGDSLRSEPKVLKKNIIYKTNEQFRRDFNKNEFYYPIKRKDTIEIPLLINTALKNKLWNDLLPNKVSFTQEIPTNLKTLFSIKADELYKRMMYVSDNFLAEQMLILASSTLSDTLDSKKVRRLILNNQLKKLKHKPRWVDASGLSRYNLFTPSSFVYVLDKMYSEIERERLFGFFSVGGKRGTLKKWFKGSNNLIFSQSQEH